MSTCYQTGQGTDDDIEEATLIDNSAVRGQHLNWCGAGGQYSMLASPASAAGSVAAKGANGVKADKETSAQTNGSSAPAPAKGKAKAAAKDTPKDGTHDKAVADAAVQKEINEMPKKMQEFIKEQISKGATVTRGEDGIEVERQTTPDVEFSSGKFGDIE